MSKDGQDKGKPKEKYTFLTQDARSVINMTPVTEGRNPVAMTMLVHSNMPNPNTPSPDTVEKGRNPGNMTPVRPQTPQPSQPPDKPLKK
jgi:hypothetical protein